MAICDICSREGSHTIVPCAEFRRTVLDGGFSPFRLGLVPGRAREQASSDYEVWCRLVRENETDWGLCRECHAAWQNAVAPARPMPVSGHGLPDSLATLRARHPLAEAPAVPVQWRPGFLARLFGRARPWGAFDDAVALLRHGRIAEARELLRRLIAHGDHAPARLLYCLESRRPPADASMHASSVVPKLSVGEKHAFDMLVAYAQGDYNWLGEALLAATSARPASSLGAFLLLAGFVGASDLWLQTQLLHPRGRQPESIVVGKPFQALALLLERRHDEAWRSFHDGSEAPADIVASYAKALQIRITGEETQALTSAACDYCEIGLGLVLFDLGYDAERGRHFARLTSRLSGNLAEACRLLA